MASRLEESVEFVRRWKSEKLSEIENGIEMGNGSEHHGHHDDAQFLVDSGSFVHVSHELLPAVSDSQ